MEARRLTLCLALLLPAAGPGRGAQPAEDAPGFVVILTDDQRWDAMGCAGNPRIRTPAMDALAARGVRFSNAFVTLSICSPSRATVLTGRYGSAVGVTRLGAPLQKGERTFAHHLKEAGYRTALVGKWHLGNEPRALGFDHVVSFASNGRYFGREVVEHGARKRAEGHIEDYCTRQSAEFLERAAADRVPFVLFHCTQLPHMDHEFKWDARPETLRQYEGTVFPMPASWRDDLSGKPPYLKTGRNRQRAMETYGYGREEGVRAHLRDYYAAITDLDAAIGKVLEAIDRLGLRDRTYVFLMGDNGWFIGEHGFTSKVLPYEESIRVPFLTAGPGVAPRVEDRMVLNADIAPTLLDLARQPLPGSLHGRSLGPLLRNGRTEWRTSFLYEAPTPVLGSLPLWAVRTPRWKYVRTALDPERTFEELYDLDADPQEVRNLAGEPEHAARRAELAAELERLRATVAR